MDIPGAKLEFHFSLFLFRVVMPLQSVKPVLKDALNSGLLATTQTTPEKHKTNQELSFREVESLSFKLDQVHLACRTQCGDL